MQYLKRKKLTKKFELALLNPLIIVSTPKGFGKRTFISHYLNERKKEHIWFHLMKDFEEDWQWKVFQEKLQRELKVIGKIPYFPIPETQEELANMLALYNEQIKNQFYIVIDSNIGIYLHLQKLMQLFSVVDTGNFQIILISDDLYTEVLQQYNDYAKFLNVDDFRLTYHDVVELFAKDKIELSKDKIQTILSYTDGWMFAVELIVMTYKKDKILTETSNINALIEAAFYQSLSADVKNDFMYLGVLNEFTLEQLHSLCESKESIKKILELENSHLFIHGTPSIGYTISGVLKNFLKVQLYHSDVDVNKVYQRVAQWFSINNEPIQAITMYLECNDFDGIVKILTLHKEQSFVDYAPTLMVNIFKRMPMSYKYENPFVYLSHILDVISSVDAQLGLSLLEDFKRDVDQGKYVGDNEHLLGEYYFIRAFSQYNDASLMMDDFAKATLYLEGGKSHFAYPFMIATFGSFHLLYLYHNKEGNLANLVEDITLRNHTLVHLSNGVCGGGEYQAKAEYAFETGDYSNVLELSSHAYLETERYQQLSIKICTIFLQARYAMMMKDTLLHQEMLKELASIYQICDIPVLRSEIECAQAYLSMLEGDLRKVPIWVETEKILYPQLLYEAGMISFIVLCFYQICTKNYTKVAYYCTVLENTYKERMHLFGALYTKLFQSIANFHLSRKQESFKCFHEACKIANADHLITIFKELGPHLKVLINEYPIKTSFEAMILNDIQDNSSSEEDTPVFHLLTKKEKEVMLKYANGMTTKQIAKDIMLSVNTVQTHLKSIYSKLRINTKTQLVQLVNSQLTSK